MSFDMPLDDADLDPHGECRHEIQSLGAEVARLTRRNSELTASEEEMAQQVRGADAHKAMVCGLNATLTYEITALRAENARLLQFSRRQADEIVNLNDMADAVEVLREIGNLIGCDHVTSPDERRQLVNCIEQTLAGKDAEVDRMFKDTADLAAERDRLYRR